MKNYLVIENFDLEERRKNRRKIKTILFNLVINGAYIYFEIDDSVDSQQIISNIALAQSHEYEDNYIFIIERTKLLEHFNLKTESEFITFFQDLAREKVATYFLLEDFRFINYLNYIKNKGCDKNYDPIKEDLSVIGKLEDEIKKDYTGY